MDDHIGHLTMLLESLDLRDVTLVAQDWGGAIGLGALLRMPERCERIVLFNTGAFPPAYIPWRIRACRIPGIGWLAVQGAGLFNRAALRMTLARRQRLDPAVAAAYLAPYDSWANRLGVYGFVRDIPSRPRQPTWQTLAEIEGGLPTLADRPALLVWGMRDWCFRPDCLKRFERAWPQAEVHRLADVGHWVMEDATDDVLPLVEDFLTRTEPRALDVKRHPLELLDHA
jgi:haloalkane dehalogenase